MSLNIALAVIGGLTLLLGLSAGLTRSKLYPVSEPMIATAVGILIGPLMWGVLSLEQWGDPKAILEQVARLTVAFSVMGIALRIPRHYFRKHARAMGSILSLGMLIMWVVSGLLSWWLLGVSFWAAMLIGAIATPTDPVLSGTIVTGQEAHRNIPARIRQAVSAEAGANDGGAYPFVFLCILMLEHPPGEAWAEWAVHTVLWEVIGAVVLGLLIGYAAGRLQRWSQSQDFMEDTSLLTITIALAVTVLGATKLIGTDGILAVFASGIAFSWAAQEERLEKETSAQEALKRVFTFPIFVFFGMVLPWHEWGQLGWTGVALVVLILLLRRPLTMLAMRPLMRPIRSTADMLFTGWFGPIGVAALYYATLSEHETGLHEAWTVGSLIIFGSVIAYGVTATPLTKWYGRYEGPKRSSHQDRHRRQQDEDGQQQEATRRR